jgi:plasmid maintenance system antidote protein VapI
MNDTNKIVNEFEPDYTYPHGDTLLEVMNELNIAIADLAYSTGTSQSHIKEVLQGVLAVTTGFAEQLEKALGIPASFWNNL